MDRAIADPHPATMENGVLEKPTTGPTRRAERSALPDARLDRLHFAQVREDPRLEIEALAPAPSQTLVVVGSGGCTALSLLAAGAGRVIAVDLNAAQNHLTELKLATVSRLQPSLAVEFLGGSPCEADRRVALYGRVRSDLTPDARAYWDARSPDIRRGVLAGGVTERLLRLIVGFFRHFILGRSAIDQLLRTRSIQEQREVYRRSWNTPRWRFAFRLFLNRAVLSRTYDPAFFAHVERPSFAEHFLHRVEHTLTTLPVADNYFLHHMLTGFYPEGGEGEVPPYLSESGVAMVRENAAGLSIVDGSITGLLRCMPGRSVDGFALSNICEWLEPRGIDELFQEIVRTARPGATLCFRNFVGWTEVPERWRGVVREERERGEQLMGRDRSLVQRRFAVCRIEPEAA